MKGLILSVCISLLSVAGSRGTNQSSFIYWEDMTTTEQDNILYSPAICKNAVRYYLKNFRTTDNKLTEELLSEITCNGNSNQEIIFYFYIFNQICLESDSALSEILGKYCMKFALINPEFTLWYFKKNPKVEKVYAELMGTEFYFKEDGSSDIEYNYKDFKKAIETRIKNNPEYKEIASLFYHEIEIVMKKMD